MPGDFSVSKRSLFSLLPCECIHTVLSYTQEVPSRFKKEVVLAADKNRDGMISVEEIDELLRSIGASEELTEEEVGR